jgi:hypothetical protein
VNKKFLSVENHRHMSLRQAKSLRRSYKFLVPVGPFMDEWGEMLGKSQGLTSSEKGEIVISLFEGFKRQDHAYGYARAYGGIMRGLSHGTNSLEAHLPFDLIAEIKKSAFLKISEIPKEEFESDFKKKLEQFECPVTKMIF